MYKNITMYIYFKNGNVFLYQVESIQKAREHAEKIWNFGYREIINGRMEWFGPHYIDKICWDIKENDYLGKKYINNEGVK